MQDGSWRMPWHKAHPLVRPCPLTYTLARQLSRVDVRPLPPGVQNTCWANSGNPRGMCSQLKYIGAIRQPKQSPPSHLRAYQRIRQDHTGAHYSHEKPKRIPESRPHIHIHASKCTPRAKYQLTFFTWQPCRA